jgi:hypothetical protein
MRNLARTGTLAAALVCTMALSGCRDLMDCNIGPVALVNPEHRSQASSAKPRRTVRSVVKRVTEPKVVHAGARIRNFCGQRHVRFQSGALKESSSEKARNDALCRQVY